MSEQPPGAGRLERQPQAERHDSRPSPDNQLRLSKRAAGQVAVNAVKVWMIRQVLGLRAESQVHGFRQFEGLVYA